MPAGQVIVFFVGLIIIIFAAYYVTYYIGLKASGRSRAGRLRNKNINLIDRFAISRDKGFYLVEIAGKVYVVGVSNQTMTLLDTLDAAAFSEAAAERRDTPQWQIMTEGKYTGPLTKKLAAFLAGKTGRTIGTNEGGANISFTDSMDKAREKDREKDCEKDRDDS